MELRSRFFLRAKKGSQNYNHAHPCATGNRGSRKPMKQSRQENLNNNDMTYFLVLIALFAVQQSFTKGYFYRRLLGGEWQKVWYNRQHNGGYEVWERRRPGFDWEAVGGRVVAEEQV